MIVKLIDFGKTTHVTQPVMYNLDEANRKIYNEKHRYLAHELRNIPHSKQSVATDIYSIGYLIKYVGYYEDISFLYDLSRSIKTVEI